MKIGKETIPHSAICTSNSETIVVRGKDLADDLIGKMSFTDYFHLLVIGQPATPAATAVLNATLVAIAEHGLVPSVQASRMTLAAAPEALQGAVAAGILGCGSVILGASQNCGIFLEEIRVRADGSSDYAEAARQVVREYHTAKRAIPGYGHPLHKKRDPRVTALFTVAEQAGADMIYVRIADVVEKVLPEVTGKALMLNVSAAIPAVLLGVGFPMAALRGVPILARTAGLIGHLTEELQKPIGFALSYQATRNYVYDGQAPDGFVPDQA
jgi:citrate synthase